MFVLHNNNIALYLYLFKFVSIPTMPLGQCIHTKHLVKCMCTEVFHSIKCTFYGAKNLDKKIILFQDKKIHQTKLKLCSKYSETMMSSTIIRFISLLYFIPNSCKVICLLLTICLEIMTEFAS